MNLNIKMPDDSHEGTQDRLQPFVGELRLKGKQRCEEGNSSNPAQPLCVLGKFLGLSEPHFAHLLNADANVGN